MAFSKSVDENVITRHNLTQITQTGRIPQKTFKIRVVRPFRGIRV
jgi:hypothetical protein